MVTSAGNTDLRGSRDAGDGDDASTPDFGDMVAATMHCKTEARCLCCPCGTLVLADDVSVQGTDTSVFTPGCLTEVAAIARKARERWLMLVDARVSRAC